MDEAQKREFEKLLQDFQSSQSRGDIQQAEGVAIQSLMLAAAAQQEPSERLRRVQEAREHENAGRWDQAEAAYRQALAAAEAEGHELLIFESHRQLSQFYATQEQLDRALQEAESALAAARKSNMPGVMPLMALGNLFRCQWMKGDLASAAATAEEAVQSTPAEKMYDLQRARALLMRAQVRVERDEIAPAQQDLDAAWRILAPQAKATFLGGIQNQLANWWEITAQIKTRSKDFPAAAEALGKAVEFRRTVSRLPQVDGPYKHHWLAVSLQKYGVALLAAGEVKAAAEAFDESRKIQERTGIAVPPTRAA